MSSLIPGFDHFFTQFKSVVASPQWEKLQSDFNSSERILLVGNGNLAVCDHGVIDVARLINPPRHQAWHPS